MPANPNAEDFKARRWVHQKILDLPEEGINIRELERQALIFFAVSKNGIRSFIKEYYVDLGHVELVGEMLKPITEEVKE